MPKLKAVDQLAMDERVIQDDALLTAIESYQNAQEEARAAAGVRKDTKAKAMALLEEMGIDIGQVVRIGRFRLERKLIPGGHREFDASDRESVTISLVEG